MVATARTGWGVRVVPTFSSTPSFSSATRAPVATARCTSGANARMAPLPR